jgi:hypothetical protein
MKSLFIRFLLLGLCLSAATAATTETKAEIAAREERVKARLAEHARRNAIRAYAGTEAKSPAPAAPETTPATGTAGSDARENITTLPSMDVRNSRITELDLQIGKLEKDIASEQKHVKSSDLDVSLNDAKSSRKFSLFGGKSTEQRESVAAERVQLMEAERDILEAMKLSKTQAELQLLQKQVDDLRAVRRNLDLALR